MIWSRLNGDCLALAGGLVALLGWLIPFQVPGNQEPEIPPARAAVPAPEAGPRLLFAAADLPGSYYLGDGLGVNCRLVIEANGRFTFRWTGCLGEYDRNQGSWTVEGDRLLMKPEKANRCQGFNGMNLRFIPVKWGARMVLVDEYEMPGFCVMAKGGWRPAGEYQHGLDYARVQDPALEAPYAGEKPIIPERFREFYELGPIEAVVAQVNSDGSVLLKGTALRPLRPGLLLASSEFGRVDLDVVSTSGLTGVARPIYSWNSDRRPKAGDRFTTGDPWRRPRGTGFRRLTDIPEEEKNGRP